MDRFPVVTVTGESPRALGLSTGRQLSERVKATVDFYQVINSVELINPATQRCL